MEENEQPSVERLNTRTVQACQRCRSLKTRCLPSERPGTCQRCFLSKRDCAWAEAPRKTRRVRGPSRISQVEQKIDGLVANLIKPAAARVPSDLQPTESIGNGGVGARPPHCPRPNAPGSWLAVPSSFEPEPPRNDQDTETDQRYLEKLRMIHSFGDDEADLSPVAGSLFSVPASNEPLVDSDLVKGLLSCGEADRLLAEYRCMSETFPFVPIPSPVSAQDLSTSRPMLFLAILTVASWKDHRLQRKLDKFYREELANRTIIRPRRTISLIQSMIVYMAWYHFIFSHKTQQTYSLLQLTIGLAVDLGLHQEIKWLLPIPGRPERSQPSPEAQRERQRAFLGCYCLASAISMALMKPNLLKYTDYMEKCARRLKFDHEYISDEIIPGLISLRRIDDQVHDTFHVQEAIELPITDSRVSMNLRFMESQLEEWKRSNYPDSVPRAIDLSFAFTDMQLHAVGLRPLPVEVLQFGQCAAQRNEMLLTLEAGRRFLDTLLEFPVDDYHIISFSDWMRVPHVVVTLSRLCIPNNSHASIPWDAKAAQGRVRLDLYLESLCHRMQGLSTYDKVKQPHPDFWRAMHMILDLTRVWYSRRIRGEKKTPHTAASYDGANNATIITSGVTPTDCPSGFSFSATGSMDAPAMGAGNLSQDPAEFMRGMDLDMDLFLDMGIWGHESYEGMGFGGGNMGF